MRSERITMTSEKSANFFIRHKQTIKFWAVAIIALAMILKGVMQIPQIKANKQQVTKLQSQIEDEKNRQTEIDSLKSEVNTDKYIEKIASEKIGLVKNNAKIFVDVSQDQ